MTISESYNSPIPSSLGYSGMSLDQSRTQIYGILYNGNKESSEFYHITENKVIRVGRALDNDIVINDQAVSLYHCLIWGVQFGTDTPPICYLKDTSLNGVFINTQPLAKNEVAMLEDGDIIEIRYSGVFTFGEPGEYKRRKHTPVVLSDSKWQITDRILGYGTFGKVFVARNNYVKGKLFAVKIINPELISKNRQLESTILEGLDHPNIIRLHDTIKSVGGQLLVFQDLISGGDLHSFLRRNGQYHRVSESETKLIAYQILSAVSYLHDNNIIHRDLKEDNILLEMPQPYSKIYITDFGSAKLVSATSRTYTAIGTLEYCAPEVGLGYKRSRKQGYGKPCDMWSIGVILYIMLTAFSPFTQGKNLYSTLQQKDLLKLNDPLIWGNISDDAKDFISKLLDTNYYERLTAGQSLNHYWIKKHINILEMSYKTILHKSNIK